MVSDNNDDQTKKPNSSAFFQQRLKGWQPVITTNNLYFYFFGIGLLFVAVGVVLVYFSFQVREEPIDYTNCTDSSNRICSTLLTSNLTLNYGSCTCSINVTITSPIIGPVIIYYQLTNFYQNHRTYVESRDDYQLHGNQLNELSSNCEPYRYVNGSSSLTSVMIAPCGTIANSLFNDTFTLEYVSNMGVETVPWTNKGIAWPSETQYRYGKPKTWMNTAKPPNWPISAQNRTPDAYSGDEELIVWMRTAALPNFRKMHRIVLQQANSSFSSGLPAGNYVLTIKYAYPVTPFGGSKQFIITSTNSLGGRNPTLGIIYLAVGTIYISLAVAFTLISAFVKQRQMTEIWQRAASINAVASSSIENFSNLETMHNNGFVEQYADDNFGRNV